MKDWIENASSMFCRAEIRRFNYDDRQPDGRREPHSQDSSGGRSHSVLPHFSNQKCGARLSVRVSASVMAMFRQSSEPITAIDSICCNVFSRLCCGGAR